MAPLQDRTTAGSSAPARAPDPPFLVFLKIAVAVMGVMLVAGFGLLAYKLATMGPSDGRAPVAADAAPVAIGPGESVRAMALDGDRLALTVTGPAGDRVVIVDLRRGTVAGEIRLEPR